ncbi:MAG: ribonuclease HI [Spirochaetia bacterium]
MAMKHLTVYTDGGCFGNPGPGGWAFIISGGPVRVVEYGAETDTTNNRMELTAVISGLRKILNEYGRGINVSLHTDSLYVQKGITSWINNWKINGWKTAGKKQVKNKDLWIILDDLNSSMKINWYWVKGHGDDVQNNECDMLVKKAINELISGE